MNKSELLIVNLVDGIGTHSGIPFEDMVNHGKKTLDYFRTNPANKLAIRESMANLNNPNYKLSKYGDYGGFYLLMNSTVSIFINMRENLNERMPIDVGIEFRKEINKFYIPYLLACFSCLETSMTTMSDVQKANLELRTHFIDEFLLEYVDYM